MSIEEIIKNENSYLGKKVELTCYYHASHELREMVSEIEKETISVEEQKEINKTIEELKDRFEPVKNIDTNSENLKPLKTWRVSNKAKRIPASGETPRDWERPAPYLAKAKIKGVLKKKEGTNSLEIEVKDIKIIKRYI